MKKGQFYILAAVILLAITFTVFALSSKSNVFTKNEDTFEELHENYVREVSEVINNMIYEKNQADLEEIDLDKLEDFTSQFMNYAKTRSPSFSLVYMFSYHEDVRVANHFDETIVVSVSGVNSTVEAGELVDLETSDIYVVYAFDNMYELERDQDIDFSAIFRSERGNEVRIFVHE